MASKRTGLVTGSLLAGALLLGTAGLVAAQDPTATPAGGQMMGGQNGGAMMGGQNGGAMMGGQMMGGAMMGGQMMGGQMGSMTAEQLEQMDALHDQMIESGVCDQAQMRALHAQLNANR